ncbi:MAG: helix-turn-helix transcriptional regulator [Bacteroidota bacterium]
MRPFAKNLKSIRAYKEWSQEKASRMIGITRASLGSYEEDRCQANLENFVKICTAYDIEDPLQFIMGKYNPASGKISRQKLSLMETAYGKLDQRGKRAVAILLGLD